MQFIQTVGETTHVVLAGKLDYATASVLMEELRTLEGQGVRRIEFDCTTLDYISSAGIRAMVYAKQKIARGVELDVVLREASANVQGVFAASGLADYFEFAA
ncbi:anti-sigma-factor antagonist [Xylanimonas cellulosilytica DSM 15894]|uniref:Anti-sigma-factor antagonist n=1 Tax=Xylanimonas cellulosilytica (strain DSM 15894 / JCM 12276 / CECT 5975 / KCTC 9989 / LMG 20990 / NBRC 107835 / XIL07) TaxID=446471 RepID=D1BYJ9_XYLCX|nr:STAS domain-containing protein [Xylanimonas cellulosilytica]ACZ31871.1 anti-sigma-factor antagonist [Xylanimonas cellulosilytica DSM 15894]